MYDHVKNGVLLLEQNRATFVSQIFVEALNGRACSTGIDGLVEPAGTNPYLDEQKVF